MGVYTVFAIFSSLHDYFSEMVQGMYHLDGKNSYVIDQKWPLLVIRGHFS